MGGHHLGHDMADCGAVCGRFTVGGKRYKVVPHSELSWL